MSSLTPRLGLTLPDALTDSMTLGDNVLSDNYDIIDRNVHCVIVTNLVDVISPFNGMHVRVTSESKNYIRKNGAWSLFTQPPVAGGSGNKVSTSTTTTATILANTADVKLYQATFTPEVGRRYLIKGSVSLGSYPYFPLVGYITLRSALGTNVTSSGTLITTKQVSLYPFDTPEFSFGSSGDNSVSFIAEIFPNNTSQLSVGVFATLFTEDTDAEGYVNPVAVSSGSITYSTISIADWGA